MTIPIFLPICLTLPLLYSLQWSLGTPKYASFARIVFTLALRP